MEKKLFRIGNSVALVIDKPLRLALGIKPTTLVRVMTDGQRLIIEPCGERSVEAKRTTAITEQTQARAIANELMIHLSTSNENFARLTAGWRAPNCRLRIMHYKMWLDSVRWDCLSAAEHRLIRRFEALYWALRGKATWDEAISAALAAEPFDPDDPTEREVGPISRR
jgi:virulence-associated protein VagC